MWQSAFLKDAFMKVAEQNNGKDSNNQYKSCTIEVLCDQLCKMQDKSAVFIIEIGLLECW